MASASDKPRNRRSRWERPKRWKALVCREACVDQVGTVSAAVCTTPGTPQIGRTGSGGPTDNKSGARKGETPALTEACLRGGAQVARYPATRGTDG